MSAEEIERLMAEGETLIQQERYEEALAVYDQALALNSTLAEAYSNKGSLLWNLERHEEALAAFERACDLEPENADFYMSMGDLLQVMERDEEALAAYGTAQRLEPDNAECCAQQGELLQELGRFQEAFFAYAHNGKGFVLESLGQPLRALACYDQANFCDPEYAPAWHNKANLLTHLGRYGEAERARRRADKLGYNW